MTTTELIERLESLGYSYVAVVEENDGEPVILSAIEPSGNLIAIRKDGDDVLDRKATSEIWDIMFIGEESFL